MPEDLISPIVTRNAPTASRGATGAWKLIIGRPVRHGVVEGDFFAKADVAHGDDTDLTAKAGIWIAAMIDVIRLFPQGDRGQI